MDVRQALVYGQTGQVLEFYPPEWVLGALSGTTTYSIWRAGDSNDDTVQLSGNATSDAVSTTFDAASGYSQTNRRKANLTATTSIDVGKAYVIANAYGQRERVVPTLIASADYVELENDLAYSYTTADTFKGLRQYFTIDATFIATESKINQSGSPYRVLWTYTVNSIVYKHWTYFDVVRQARQHNVNFQDLMELFPDLGQSEWLEQRGQKFGKQIDAAWDRVRFDAQMNGLDLNDVRDSDLDEVVRSCAIWKIAEAGVCPGGWDVPTWEVKRAEQYKADFGRAIAVQNLKVSQSREGGITQTPLRPITFRR